MQALEVTHRSNLCISPSSDLVPVRPHTRSAWWTWKRQPFQYYLVESCHGELLVVADDFHCSENCPRFTVHRVNVEAGELVQVNDLGDQMLFVGEGCYRSVLHRSCSWLSSFITSNAIYFFQPTLIWKGNVILIWVSSR